MKLLNILIPSTALLALAGCVGRPVPSERAARQDLQAVTAAFRPPGERPALPTLTTNSSLADFLRFAMLNHPQVEAAYFDWAASVERITVERSLPDPKLTFEMDIKSIVEVVMPGLMAEFPGPGKLRAAANVASAESRMKYFAFEAAAVQTALAFKRAYYQNHFLSEKIRVTQRTLDLARDLEQIARQQNEVGKTTMQDALRAQIEHDKLKNEIANLEDSRAPLLAQMKAALGLKHDQPDPPVPAHFETTPVDVSSDQVLAAAFARNPRLKAMEADVRRAEAAIHLAHKARVPDFSGGVEVDALASPVMVRPSAGMTLPIWRDKLRAQMAEAQAGKRAAEARLSAEQIALAVELAEKSFMLREATRKLTLVQDNLLPKASLSVEVARAGYLAGKTEFMNVLDAWRTLLEFEMTIVEARTQRELALAELSLAIIGAPPTGASVLNPAPASTATPESQTTDKSHAN